MEKYDDPVVGWLPKYTLTEINEEISLCERHLNDLLKIKQKIIREKEKKCEHTYVFERDYSIYPEHSWTCTKCGKTILGGPNLFKET